MITYRLTLVAFLQVHDWSSLHWLTAIVWSGFGLLTLALLVLMRSSWGRERPLAKCAALSLVAHGLLALSAYGTRLVFQQPDTPRDSVVRLRTIDLEEASLERSPTKPQQPWEVTSLDRELPDAESAEEPPPADSTPRVDPWKPAVSQPNTLATSAAVSEIPTGPVPPQTSPAPLHEHMVPAQEDRPAVEVATTPAAPPPQVASREPVAPSAGQDVSGLPTDVAAPPPQVVTPLAPVASRVGTPLPPLSTNGPLDVDRLTESIPAPAPVTPLATDEAKRQVNQLPPLTRPGDGRAVPHIYRLRLDAQREEWFLRMGGNADSLRAVRSALEWLVNHQESDGRWDADRFEAGHEQQVLGHDRQGAGTNADTGMTGLALLAFLGAGHTQYQGDYQQVVQRGLNYLRRQQHANGNLAGSARLFAAMYCHGMASLALSEAYAMTGDPQLQPAVTRAIEFTLRSQHAHGGWRYQPGDSGDMSQFGWQVMAVSSARYAGLGIAESQRDRMRDFLQRCSVGTHRALAGYRPGQPATTTMSAEAMVCRVFLQQLPSEDGVRQFEDYLAQDLPGPGKANLYYWYYGTLALHQLQGPTWQDWSSHIQRELVRRQCRDGDAAGSWNPDTVWGCYGGRVYSTALAALTLEVYFRYLPIYAWSK